jgi:hypothetical protein
MTAAAAEATAKKHRREAVRQLRLGDAHREIGEIQDQIDRLQHRREMLEIFIAGAGEGEPQEPLAR